MKTYMIQWRSNCWAGPKIQRGRTTKIIREARTLREEKKRRTACKKISSGDEERGG